MKRYLLLISMLAAFVAESAAREVYRLNDDWTFYFRSENSADDARNITLPHTWNLDALAGNSEYQRTTGNYMRRLYIPADWASKRLFRDASTACRPWPTSSSTAIMSATHRGGSTAFTFEITDKMTFRQPTTRLLVVVSNSSRRTTYCPPRPSMNLYGGIYRDGGTDPDRAGRPYRRYGLGSDRRARSPSRCRWTTTRSRARAAVYVSAPKDCTAGC